MSGWVEGNQSRRIRLLFAFSAQLKKNYRPPVTFRMFSSFYSHKSPLRIAGALTLSPNPAPATFVLRSCASHAVAAALQEMPKRMPSSLASRCALSSAKFLRRWFSPEPPPLDVLRRSRAGLDRRRFRRITAPGFNRQMASVGRKLLGA
jgi:hypothetical protein